MTSSTNPAPLTRDSILTFLRAVDAELAASEPDGQRRLLVIAGGAVMALLALRATTLNIDSATRLDPAIKAAADRVAERDGLDKTVLNDAGSAWQPATLDIEACPVILDGQRLTVRQVPIDLLFIMKLDASRLYTMDAHDLTQLGALVSFTSAVAIQTAHEAAYPNTPPDPHLGEFAWTRYVAPARTQDHVAEDVAAARLIRERTGQPEVTWDEALEATGVTQPDVDAVNLDDYAIEGENKDG